MEREIEERGREKEREIRNYLERGGKRAGKIMAFQKKETLTILRVTALVISGDERRILKTLMKLQKVKKTNETKETLYLFMAMTLLLDHLLKGSVLKSYMVLSKGFYYFFLLSNVLILIMIF